LKKTVPRFATLHGRSTILDHQEEIDRELERNTDVGYWRKQVKQASSVAAKAA
jgi:hypothetical protein